MPDNLALRTADHERRDLFRGLQARWEADIKSLTVPPNEDDTGSFMRLMLADLISDAQGEIDELTDRIGDERGDDYAVERSMHAFRSAGL